MTISRVFTIHQLLINMFGGTSEVRDMSLLESAVQRPYATFDGVDLYKTPVEKAAAIVESIEKTTHLQMVIKGQVMF